MSPNKNNARYPCVLHLNELMAYVILKFTPIIHVFFIKKHPILRFEIDMRLCIQSLKKLGLCLKNRLKRLYVYLIIQY